MASKDFIETLLTGNNAAFIETQYMRFTENPSSVEDDWQAFFKRMENGAAGIAAKSPSWARKDWPPVGEEAESDIAPPEPKFSDATITHEEVKKATLDSLRVLMMIRSYRVRGHLIAELDPLGLEDRPPHPELEPASYGFGEADLDRPIFIDNVLGLDAASVREILEILHHTYCSSVGVEFMHINVPEEKAWIQSHIEGRGKDIHFSPEGKKAILKKLIEAEQFEKFLGRKFVGTKRFGLDGGEAMVPALEAIIKTGGQLGIKELVIGMAHRGRLNVLANVLQKPFRAIFNEFQGGSYKPEDVQGSGDVKYHLGTSADREFDGNTVHLSLTANPSHLEAVDPVALGKTRAKQVQLNDESHDKVATLLIHGDAAFAGQGIVAECFMLSGLHGYRTGGTVHFIINNQIGFTTHPHHSRSSPYPSASAKIVQAPIFHVNGDDPEAVVSVTKLATQFRQTFNKDVVVDMVCYRRFGHNESDEPAFTQPKMYARIKAHQGVAEMYRDRLIDEGVLNTQDYDALKAGYLEPLDAELKSAPNYKPEKADRFEKKWKGMEESGDHSKEPVTGMSEKTLKAIGEALTTIPEGFNIHKTLARGLANKTKMFKTGEALDWATAEALALGGLLQEGYGVRLAGQDTIRGTFSQRHAKFIDQQTEEIFCPLESVAGKSHFEVIDSPLSETGVLGFEYGFSQAEPNMLVVWEAQFGDFVNVAQVVIDQFISSAEAKWLRYSGLVMLLPHGYEGQGPEHSSARLERFLQLCAENNMQVANCSTPANYFHILRRQLHRDYRKPLVIMTPKSLLRHKGAVSSLGDLAGKTTFQPVLPDMTIKKPAGITRVILCSGKVYYDLLAERDGRKLTDTALVRVEQLYPFPAKTLEKLLSRLMNAEKVIWCQEEPKNMGAWFFVEPRLEEILEKVDLKNLKRAQYVGRPESAATATGLASVHEKEQAALVDQALTL